MLREEEEGKKKKVNTILDTMEDYMLNMQITYGGFIFPLSVFLQSF